MRKQALLAAVLLAPACGGAGGSPTAVSSPAVNNVQPVQVNLGPARDYVNGLFTSVTICVPGTSTCQTIDDVLVDSGSDGLRLLSSVVTLPLAPSTDIAGNVLANCATFADNTYAWGTMSNVSVRLAGEQAASLPMQLIGGPGIPDAPSDCSSGGTADDSVAALGATGILGIGVFREDCGGAARGPTRRRSTTPAAASDARRPRCPWRASSRIRSGSSRRTTTATSSRCLRFPRPVPGP